MIVPQPRRGFHCFENSPAFQRRGHWLTVICFLLMAALSASLAQAHAQGVQITFGAQGLSSLTHGGIELLWSNPSDGTHGAYDGSVFWVQKVVLRGPDGTLSTVDQGGPSAVAVDAAHGVVTRTFAWGRVQGVFTVHANRLDIAITVADKSPQTTVQEVYLQPLWLKFPQTPAGYNGDPRLLANLGSPTVIGADYGSGVLALCNDDVRRPLLVGFPWAFNHPGLTIYPLLIVSRSNGWLGNLLDNRIVRPIAPGHSDAYDISLRFGPAGTAPADLATDLDAKDVTTDVGRAAFRTKLMAYADNSIHVLNAMNAQSAITWDIEGQEYPHATSYIGDPRLVPQLAPAFPRLVG